MAKTNPGRCRATTARLDGHPLDRCHCQLTAGHDGPHLCEHGFDFGGGPRRAARWSALFALGYFYALVACGQIDDRVNLPIDEPTAGRNDGGDPRSPADAAPPPVTEAGGGAEGGADVELDAAPDVAADAGTPSCVDGGVRYPDGGDPVDGCVRVLMPREEVACCPWQDNVFCCVTPLDGG